MESQVPDIPVRDNHERRRFELEVDGKLVFADYRRQDLLLYIPHVEAAPSLRGTGAASRLMRGVMDLARREGLKVIPLCSYARIWMHRHPEHHDLLA